MIVVSRGPSYEYQHYGRSIRSGRTIQEPFAIDPQQYAPLLDLHETSGRSKPLEALPFVQRDNSRRPAYGEFRGSPFKAGWRIQTDEIRQRRLRRCRPRTVRTGYDSVPDRREDDKRANQEASVGTELSCRPCG